MNGCTSHQLDSLGFRFAAVQFQMVLHRTSQKDGGVGRLNRAVSIVSESTKAVTRWRSVAVWTLLLISLLKIPWQLILLLVLVVRCRQLVIKVSS